MSGLAIRFETIKYGKKSKNIGIFPSVSLAFGGEELKKP